MRHGKRWTISELLSLQREYELLGWTVQEIASKHQRTINSILFKLEDEGFIHSWNDARGFDPLQLQEQYASPKTWKDDDDDEDYVEDDEGYVEDDDEDYVEEDEDYVEEEEYDSENNKVSKLAERVWSLETAVNDISGMVKQLFDSMINNSQPKKRQLSCSAH